ncbi:MAG: YceD family protein [Verrucomicrobiae bacterium]|nr:YceD family protein [Verrucomicrobiae bacterium]
MPLLVNLRHLERHDVRLAGELPVADLDIDTRDEMIVLQKPLKFRIAVQGLPDGLLVRGRLSLPLNCQCVRCLKPFIHKLDWPDWSCLIPLTGEDAVTRDGDTVDLTPFLREDILLELPQHPLCNPDCGGLKPPLHGRSKKKSPDDQKTASAWAILDKVKFRKE